MTENMQTLATKPVGFIRFWGITLMVVQNNGKEYVDARQLNDAVGLTWRSTRTAIQRGDHVTLYGTKWLLPPIFGLATPHFRDTSIPKNRVSTIHDQPSGPETRPQEAILHLPLDGATFFLARVSTNHMRAKGKEDAANTLLKLQMDWRDALERYRQTGSTAKKSQADAQSRLIALMKARDKAMPHEIAAINLMIADLMDECGYAVNLPTQAELAL